MWGVLRRSIPRRLLLHILLWWLPLSVVVGGGRLSSDDNQQTPPLQSAQTMQVQFLLGRIPCPAGMVAFHCCSCCSCLLGLLSCCSYSIICGSPYEFVLWASSVVRHPTLFGLGGGFRPHLYPLIISSLTFIFQNQVVLRNGCKGVAFPHRIRFKPLLHYAPPLDFRSLGFSGFLPRLATHILTFIFLFCDNHKVVVLPA